MQKLLLGITVTMCCLNMPKPEINREKSQNINEQLKKLRERVGN